MSDRPAAGEQAFVYEPLPTRVVFGAGSVARVPEETRRLGLRRILVVSTPGRRGLAERIAASLGADAAGVFDRAREHVPADDLPRAVERALAVPGADPRLVTREAVHALLTGALLGTLTSRP